jgi:hypothetical protein
MAVKGNAVSAYAVTTTALDGKIAQKILTEFMYLHFPERGGYVEHRAQFREISRDKVLAIASTVNDELPETVTKS